MRGRRGGRGCRIIWGRRGETRWTKKEGGGEGGKAEAKPKILKQEERRKREKMIRVRDVRLGAER